MAFKNKVFVLLALIALSIGINIYFRLNTFFLRNLQPQARLEVFDGLKKKLAVSTFVSYPGLNNEDRIGFLNTLLPYAIKQDKKDIDIEIARKSKELKSYFQDEKGWTYLLEVDPYRWLRRVNNYLTTGIFGTRLVNGKEYDDLIQAPIGCAVEPINIHYYIGVYLYKVLHLINNRLTLANILALHPLFFTPVMVLAIFAISIMLGISYPGAFVSSLVIGLSPTFLFRSSFGWFDTDIYNIFMPLLIITCLAYSFRSANIKNRVSFVLAGILVGISSGLWSAWWLMFYILLLGLCLYRLEAIFYDKRHTLTEKLKDSCFSVFLFILCSYVSVLLISGPQCLEKSFIEPFLYLGLRDNLSLGGFWPNISYDVLELMPSDTSFISGGVGGSIILYGGLAGIILFFLRKKADFTEKKFIFYVMFIWLVVTLVLTWQARRFIVFLVVPVAIFLGIFLDTLKDTLYLAHNRIRFLNKFKASVFNNLLFVGIFLSASAIPVYNTPHADMLPIMNDSWYNMLMEIKNNTPSEAIINTWWGPGDFFMSVAGRATLNDASWQYTPVPYWLAKALLSPSEEESFGILRMLNSGSSLGFDELSKALGNNKTLALEITNKLINSQEAQGRAILAGYVKDGEAINKISKLIYGPHRPAYLVVNNEMINSMGILSSIANWDFGRLDQWQAFVKLGRQDYVSYLKQRYGYTKEYAESIYKTLRITGKKNIRSWISPTRYSFLTSFSEQANSTQWQNPLLFDNGIAVYKINLKALFYDSLDRAWIYAGRVIFINGESVTENINKEGNPNYTVLFSKKDNIYKASIFDSPIADTLLFRLYFTNGMGLKHFKLVHEEVRKGYFHIFLYKIDSE
jgi:dolichyl-diphosphooligosaccharide--protein glycosyltransferase